jgi:hypothetical protein
MHMDVLMATDFLTTEVWTKAGLATHYVLFFIHLTSRKVHVADMTPHPDERWMVQVVRNVTMTDWGFLVQGQYLIHDRDGTYCPACQHPIDEAGITRVPLPPRSLDLNAYAERWGRSVKEEVLSRLILFGEGALQHALKAYDVLRLIRRPPQLPPGTTTWVAICTDIVQAAPASIGTVGMGTEVHRGIHLTWASLGKGHRCGWLRRGWRRGHSLLLAGGTIGLMGETWKRFGFGRALARCLGRPERFGARGGAVVGPHHVEHETQPHKADEQQPVEKRIWNHGIIPSHR